MLNIIFIAFVLMQGANSQPAAKQGGENERTSAPQQVMARLNKSQVDVQKPNKETNPSDQKQAPARDNPPQEKKAADDGVSGWTIFVAIATIAGGLATVVYAIFAILQWRSIKMQSRYASEQVVKMQGQLDVMKQQENLMRDSLQETRRLVEQNERSIEIQAKNSEQSAGIMAGQLDIMKESLAETRRIFELTERPFLHIQQTFLRGFDAGLPAIPQVLLANKGRSPAQNIAVEAYVAAALGKGYSLGFEEPVGIRHTIRLSFLGAGDEVWLEGAELDAVTLDQDFIDRAVAHTEDLVIHGTVRYDDPAGKSYAAGYCFFFDGRDRVFRPKPYPKWAEPST